jgi:hypothetical protein
MKKSNDDLQQLLIDDLEKSGIPAKYIDKLGLTPLTKKETAKFLGIPRTGATSYKIPFFDASGEQIPFARLRLLTGKWSLDGRPSKKSYRYSQRANTAPHLYFPPVRRWNVKNKKIKLDYLCVTEGEKKAVKACLCGIPTVALSGVFNFKAKKRFISLIDEMRLFDLSDGVLEICYDSDAYSNEAVLVAMNQLASECMQLGPAHIRYVRLKGDSRTGLDDFLASFETNEEAREAFYALEREEDARVNAMAAFDKDLVYIERLDQFYSRRTEKFTTRAKLIDRYENLPKIPDPVDMRKRTSPIKFWFENRSPKSTVWDLQYIPGQGSQVEQEGRQVINVWKPPMVQRVKGTPALWLTLVDHLFQNVSLEHRRWFLQWLAYPIQNPGAKLMQAVFLYTRTEGVGKNFIVDPFMKGIFGENYTRQDGSILESPYNAWMGRRQFIFIDEVHLTVRHERITMMNRLKSMITNSNVEVNEKFQPLLSLSNHGNLYITSNYSDALPLGDSDRRMFVVRGPEQKLEKSFYDALDTYGRKEKGIGEVYNYLMEYDTTGFSPTSRAPHTESREEVIHHSADNVTYFVERLKREPSAIFAMNGKLPDKELYTASELLAAVNNHANSIGMGRLGISPDAMGRYLVNAELTRKIKLKVRIGDRTTSVSLYAIFHAREWRERQNSDWVLHYKEHDPRFDEEE